MRSLPKYFERLMKRIRNSRAYVAALCKMGHFAIVGNHECRECRNARTRCNYAHNRESVLSQQRSYQNENRETVRARNRDYGNERPAERAIRVKAWLLAHPERARELNTTSVNNRRSRRIAAEGTHTRAEWLAIVARQNDKCLHCPQTGNLSRDHIVPLSRGGSNYASNIQGLCKPCNSRKGARIPTNAV